MNSNNGNQTMRLWNILILTAVLSASGLSQSIGYSSIEQQYEELGRIFDLSGTNLSKPIPVSAGPAASADKSQNTLKEQMLQNLEFMRNVFAAGYAPMKWKEKYSQGKWSLDNEIEKAKNEIISADKITTRDYQRIAQKLINSFQDYHVGISFQRTESAYLPFSIFEAEGKYFIAWINRVKLPETSFPFKIGDEITQFDGRDIKQIIKELRDNLAQGVAGTDRAMAAMFLTARPAAYIPGMEVPREPVTISIKKNGTQEITTHQLAWEYRPEDVSDMKCSSLAKQKSAGEEIIGSKNDMLVPFYTEKAISENPFGLGTRKSFIPDLGVKIWETSKDAPFYAYMYKSPVDSKLIGYIRIPSYTPSDADEFVQNFADIMNKFESVTEGLVIDQVNNPGGSIPYLYALVSMLTDKALATPRHRIALTQEDVKAASDRLRGLQSIKNDDEAKQALGKSYGGYPVSYQFVVNMRNYSQFIIDEWKKGNKLTSPTHLRGVDKINPSTIAKYTKPILLIVNELDFSGGDFFPTIMQDNKRAKIFGARTAGAGGYVHTVKYPNCLGIDYFTKTGSIAERVDGNPIENLGVTPDIKYSLTSADLQNSFKGYVKAINITISQIAK